ncbi:hypothetical protein [Hominifimenecus sp. rT4P-3]|uniref:hypothetical protein n=1 Tax=Hominifimenecus sp. rT4P-3 TaxID=3242979 RepID=UPI003DA50EFA
MIEQELPVGFGFSLAMNESAMNRFASMSDAEKKQVLEAARQAQTKDQMEQIVRDIAQLEDIR